MKKSTRLIAGLSILLLSGMLATDVLLKQAYSKMNVSDPFKNYQDIAVKPFKAIRVTGGNAYAIHIRDSDSFNIKVMNSRKGFLKVATTGDTLSLLFTVPKNGKQQALSGLPVGVIIYCPDLSYLQCTGTAVMLSDIQSHVLTIEQKGNALTELTGNRADSLHIHAYEGSWLELGANNQIDNLEVNASGDAGVSIKGTFKQFHPHLSQNGKLLFYEASIGQLMK